MRKTNDGGAAFPPSMACDLEGRIWPSDQLHEDGGGMSLRDYFAAKAMQGSMANPDHADSTGITEGNHASIAKYAYRVADAMIAERAK